MRLFRRARGRDTAKYKQLEDDLKKSEERLRSLIELAPDGIVTSNMKGQVTSINTAYSKLTGFSKDEVVGKHFTKIGVFRLRDLPKIAKIVGSWMRGEDPKPTEFRYLHRDGRTLWGEAHFKVIRVGKTKRELIGILRDITDRKRHEEEMRNLMEDLERSNRELDDYTYAVSHDLKAPLRTIEAFSGFLLDDYSEKLDETGKEYLKRMSDASIRMKDLVDDLLLLSRVGRKYTETEMVDLNKMIQGIEQDLEAQIKDQGAEIIIDRLPTIKTQRVWMRQLFSNLISNGLKFNKSPTPRVEVGCEERPADYLFSVMDNGIGIKKRDQKKLFKIFQRLHTQEEYPGTGAGLAMCKKIVESFGGKIWVESKPGAGSTFYFTYPKERTEETDVSEYPPEIDQSILQLQEELQTSTDSMTARAIFPFRSQVLYDGSGKLEMKGELGVGPAERTISVDPLNLIQVMLAEGIRWEAPRSI